MHFQKSPEICTCDIIVLLEKYLGQARKFLINSIRGIYEWSRPTLPLEGSVLVLWSQDHILRSVDSRGDKLTSKYRTQKFKITSKRVPKREMFQYSDLAAFLSTDKILIIFILN